MIKHLFFLFCLFIANVAFGQNENSPQMADAFREQGKIYVVIAVIAIVFISIVLFLTYIERKVKRLEKEIEEKNQSPQS